MVSRLSPIGAPARLSNTLSRIARLTCKWTERRTNIAIDSEGAKGQSPKHQINLRMQWDVSKRVALDTAIYYVDALPAYGVSSYWRLDVRLGWRLTEKLQLDVVGQTC